MADERIAASKYDLALLFQKVPSRDCVGEVFRMFILAEGYLGLNSVDTAAGRVEKGPDIAAVLAIVDFDDLLPDCAIFDFFCYTFQDDGFIGFFRANHTVGIDGEVLRLARAWASAEPESILPPDAPHQHEVGAAIGPRGGDPVVVGFFESLEGPLPGFEAGCRIRRILQGVGPVRSAHLGFGHWASFASGVMRRNFIRLWGMKLKSYGPYARPGSMKFLLQQAGASRRFASMRVDAVESIPERRGAMGEASEDPSVKRALLNFRSAIQSEDSLFEGHPTDAGRLAMVDTGHGICSGDFVLAFRGKDLSHDQGVHYQLIQRLIELLKNSGSQDVVAARLCLISEKQSEASKGAFVLRIQLEAVGESSEQAALRWGLGLAQLQQALLFTSR